jgi:exodeoxyribonuclease VII large subunit
VFDDPFRRQSLTVAQLTHHIASIFDEDIILRDVWVAGEVSNMTRASSGHWYFTLKDQESQLKGVMWRTSASRQQFTPQNGDAVEVHGQVQVYSPRGEYQLYADLLRPIAQGAGDLYQQFERLKAKLQLEGLFDSDRKRETPTFPLKIGVVTSPTAAAFQDILNVLGRRFPLAEVILSPSMVQGAEAPAQIVRALERLNDYADIDVILLCRGGGSMEDLWAFNDERVARAVVASRIPIVTGVGHETDFTIVDFVSDVRAPTPSAAAELITPDIEVWLQMVDDQTALMTSIMDDRIANANQQLRRLSRELDYQSPLNKIRAHRQRIDDLTTRVTRQTKGTLALLRERLTAQERALKSADPKAILSRGYAIVTRADGTRVTSQRDVKTGQAIHLQFSDGEISARVEDKEKNDRYPNTLF